MGAEQPQEQPRDTAHGGCCQPRDTGAYSTASSIPQCHANQKGIHSCMHLAHVLPTRAPQCTAGWGSEREGVVEKGWCSSGHVHLSRMCALPRKITEHGNRGGSFYMTRGAAASGLERWRMQPTFYHVLDGTLLLCARSMDVIHRVLYEFNDVKIVLFLVLLLVRPMQEVC